ncbi:hypothetical protein Ahy_A03g013551 isoform C [Arachis hypogaea]|uniref:Uncharacterized protein n=1 Tax=Arachis hypogaea TaxID=3818 RepID=A0A445DVP2_ARAHY|nr:hypothetical protein Ahy_A03g013551 isoform C [Arachis hypogaea]
MTCGEAIVRCLQSPPDPSSIPQSPPDGVISSWPILSRRRPNYVYRVLPEALNADSVDYQRSKSSSLPKVTSSSVVEPAAAQMEASQSAGVDPEQPSLTSELQPLGNIDEPNWKNDADETKALNLDLTMEVPLLNAVSPAGIFVEEFIPPSAYKSPPQAPLESIEACLMAIEQLVGMLEVRAARSEALIVYIKTMISTLCKKEEILQMIPTPKAQLHNEATEKKTPQAPNTLGGVGSAAAVVLNNSKNEASALMFTHQLSSSEKGKGILGDPVTNLTLDVIVSDSSGSEDDLLLLDHLSSTAVLSTGATLIPTEAPASLHWSRGVPKMLNDSKDEPFTACNATVQRTTVGGDLDSPTRLTDLDAFSEPGPKRQKTPRLLTSDLAATALHVGSMGSPPKTHSNSVPQTRPLFRRGGRGVGDAFRRRTWTTRPTADMSLTKDECRLGTYIFAKNEEMGDQHCCNAFVSTSQGKPYSALLVLPVNICRRDLVPSSGGTFTSELREMMDATNPRT